MMSSDRTGLLEEIHRAGWDFRAPSEECIQSTRRPPMPSRLKGIDVAGIHNWLVNVALIRRFASGRKDSRARVIQISKISILYVLREVRVEGRVSLGMVAAAQGSVIGWEHGRLREAKRRLDHAVQVERLGPGQLLDSPDQFEPALTLAIMLRKARISDHAYNQRELARGLHMHEKDSIHAESGPPLSYEDMAKTLSFLCDRATHLARVDENGLFKIRPKAVKAAMDGLLGRSRPQDQARISVARSFSDAVYEDLDPTFVVPSPLTELVEEESSRRTLAVIRDRLAGARPGSSRAAVLSHFQHILDGDLSINELAKKLDRNEAPLRRAFKAEAREIHREITAAG